MLEPVIHIGAHVGRMVVEVVHFEHEITVVVNILFGGTLIGGMIAHVHRKRQPGKPYEPHHLPPSRERHHAVSHHHHHGRH